VLQGLDASGKDSTIKHVMSGLNPQGVEVRSFKRPSAAEVREHAGQPIGPAASMFVIVLAQSEATARTYAARHDEAFSAASDLVGLGAANTGPGVGATLTRSAARSHLQTGWSRRRTGAGGSAMMLTWVSG
jgi:MFS superfamily sulfate permease-like transporter